MVKKIEILAGEVDGKNRFKIYFKYSQEVITVIKGFPGAQWNHYGRYWHIAYSQANMNRLTRFFGDLEKYDMRFLETASDSSGRIRGKNYLFEPLDQKDQDLLKAFRDFMAQRRYSASTIKTYTDIILTFMRFLKPKRITDDVEGEAERFTTEYILPRKLSFSYQNQFINAFKLLYREVIKRPLLVEKIQRPKREFKLPNVLSKQEVKLLLKVTRNLKHRAMLSLIYACGLRRSELLNLKPQDIDSDRGVLTIRNAKGRKDRVVPISEKTIELLREYYQQFLPKEWLFEGITAGNQYDERSLQNVLKKSIYLAKIKKQVTLHWLRHSYATHLHEAGVDIRFIQVLLGHKSCRTTEIYTHVSQKSLQRIRSPFDDL